jgi:uncharacterized protein
MQSREDCLKKIHLIKSVLINRFHIKKIGIFGSVARCQNTEKSDLDLIVDFSEPIGMMRFLELQDYLKEALNVNVDLTTPRALKPVRESKLITRSFSWSNGIIPLSMKVIRMNA